MFNISKYLKKLPDTKKIRQFCPASNTREEAVDVCSRRLNDVLILAKANDVPLPLIFSEAKKKLHAKDYDLVNLGKL